MCREALCVNNAVASSITRTGVCIYYPIIWLITQKSASITETILCFVDASVSLSLSPASSYWQYKTW